MGRVTKANLKPDLSKPGSGKPGLARPGLRKSDPVGFLLGWGLVLGFQLSGAILLGRLPAVAAPVRGAQHGMTSAQLRQLRQMPTKAIVPGKLPKGYTFKQLQVQTGSNPRYQIEYRCFCGGQNFTLSLLGTTKPYALPKALSPQLEKIQAKALGSQLQLGLYPKDKGFREDYYHSNWLGPASFKMAIFSAMQGTRAPKADLIVLMQGLEYLK
jgi:hypothetical protein